MKIAGTRELDASAEIVWSVLNDPSRLAKALPGVESVQIDDDRHWRATVRVPLGVGGLRVQLHFEKLEERPIELARLRASGSGVGAVVTMETSFRLTAIGGCTTMVWEADVQIAGPIGTMGERVLRPAVEYQVESVLGAIEAEVAAARAAAAGT
jgi:carbon monoxide dehydrogenase subunit G